MLFTRGAHKGSSMSIQMCGFPTLSPSPKQTSAGVGVVEMQAAPKWSTWGGGEMSWPHFRSSSEPLCRFPLPQWAKELCPPSCITVSKFNDWHLWGARRSWGEAYRAHVRKYRGSILSVKKCVRFAKGNIGWRQSWEKRTFEKSQEDSTEGRTK